MTMAETITIKISYDAYQLLEPLQRALEKETGFPNVTQIGAASTAIKEAFERRHGNRISQSSEAVPGVVDEIEELWEGDGE
jgi:hypothetical protein